MLFWRDPNADWQRLRDLALFALRIAKGEEN